MEANLVGDKAAVKVKRWISPHCEVFKFSAFKYKQETIGCTVYRCPIFSRIMPVLSYIPSSLVS